MSNSVTSPGREGAASLVATCSRRGFRSRIAKSRAGATSLEFAILAVPFWLFLLFLFEISLDFYVQLALDYAVQQGARTLQTGGGNAALSAAMFKTDCMCPPVAAFLNCNQITVNVFPVTTTDYYTNALTGAGSIPLSTLVVDIVYNYTPVFGKFFGPLTMRQTAYFNQRSIVAPYITYNTAGASSGGVVCTASGYV